MSRKNIQIISAGAGSGKTYTLTQRMLQSISGDMRISGLIATTFTQKAASELQHRVRELLLEEKLFDKANELSNAMIGTVHSIGVKLLQRFAFEAGVSPEVSVLAVEDAQIMFNNAFSFVLTQEKINHIDLLASRLGKNKKQDFDWRKEVRMIADIARANDFDCNVLQKSKEKSFSTFAAFLPEKSQITFNDLIGQLQSCISETIENLNSNGDTTKTTADVIAELKKASVHLKHHQDLEWFQWVKLYKLNPAVKSRDLMQPLREIVIQHEALAEFQNDIKNYIDAIFDAAVEAITEFQNYKKKRGLIDYTDMEVQVKNLLHVPSVRNTLEKELDLLMVDEFQDTSPLQLDNFLNLSQLAAKSVWVGDPKQSIYGFRGADPELMQAIINNVGINKDDILKFSYRSRKDLVLAVNAIFSKAFKNIPKELIPLEPIDKSEDPGLSAALMHWHFRLSEGGKSSTKEWFHQCIAHTLSRKLADGFNIQSKDKKTTLRIAKPGDVAILCRSNNECADMAAALHHAGLKAAISRSGLVETSEIQLVMACLKFMLQHSDALAVAEILLLASNSTTADIIVNRLDYLEQLGDDYDEYTWANEDKYIKKIIELREKSKEFSASEMLQLLVEELDLRRIVMTWGNVDQRLANLDVLQKMALDYEEACNRKNSAASLGGFMLWINEIAANNLDIQAAGEASDAVNVLTYHKSKGLEWPIVICHSLENELLDDIWGMRIIPDQEEVDLDRLLEKRWLQFWINPYADQSSGTPLIDRIKSSDFQKRVNDNAREEEARLLYVGMTRASDYLIFPTRQKPAKWLNRVCMDNGEVETLDPGKNDTNWEWNGHELTVNTGIFEFGRDFEEIASNETKFAFFDKRSGRKNFERFLIDPEGEGRAALHKAQARLIHCITSPLKGNDDKDDHTRVNVLYEYHRSLASQGSPEIQKKIIGNILTRNGISTEESELMLQSLKSFTDLLKNYYGVCNELKNYPLRVFEDNRKFETQVDYFAETASCFLVLKHDTYAGDRESDKAQSLAEWSYWVKKAIKTHENGDKGTKVLIHFISSGNIYEL